MKVFKIRMDMYHNIRNNKLQQDTKVKYSDFYTAKIASQRVSDFQHFVFFFRASQSF